jgi:hypothetical protein
LFRPILARVVDICTDRICDGLNVEAVAGFFRRCGTRSLLNGHMYRLRYQPSICINSYRDGVGMFRERVSQDDPDKVVGIFLVILLIDTEAGRECIAG